MERNWFSGTGQSPTSIFVFVATIACILGFSLPAQATGSRGKLLAEEGLHFGVDLTTFLATRAVGGIGLLNYKAIADLAVGAYNLGSIAITGEHSGYRNAADFAAVQLARRSGAKDTFAWRQTAQGLDLALNFTRGFKLMNRAQVSANTLKRPVLWKNLTTTSETAQMLRSMYRTLTTIEQPKPGQSAAVGR